VNQTLEEQELSLPGYTLSTRLGSGGYGEVWLAHAPGGLTKAVKFIYGSFHDKRAEHELRALQRIKDHRHPFLLSLERIEVVNGRLVIVTELADHSLKDRFDQCQREGLRGIPRDELLRYLHDAADALDFLGEKHGLQHLDIKPENLLLVAGHVKVADFGLVKDVGNSQASLVAGLTPLYSSPEVFQGSPSARSDQYSLAVLYQEMLTGMLPFSGVTAAELTLQHLHDEPDFSLLPTADRYVLARALAKDPSQRYASCSELATALLNAETSGDWTADRSATTVVAPSFESELQERRSAPRPGPVTEFFDEQIKGPRQELSASMLLDWEPPADTALRSLPPIALDVDEPFEAQPTLVVGIGNAAASVLRQLRQRMSKQFGDEPVPAVQLLLLDSDAKAIARALQGDERSALKPEETLALPLRRPQEYREQSGRLMRWLSRRWLYNIPKSLQTEGLRPLGRLAFADHARQAVQRIRMSLAQATDAESVRSSSEQTSIRFCSSAARVYIVASVSGGAGSGMSLDVGYAIRTALEKAGLNNAQVIGIFLHAIGNDPRRCDLARVNTHAWLTEYNHFHRPGGEFCGDESCSLPPRGPGQKAFDCAYLLDLAADEAEFETRVQSIAEYIYLDALTPAQAFFEKCRTDSPPDATGVAALRTFSLQRIATAADASIEGAAMVLGREVALRWVNGDESQVSGAAKPAVRDTDQLVQGAAKLVSQLQLKLEGLASNARGLIESQYGGDQQVFIDNLIQLARQDGNAAQPGEMVRMIDSLFAAPADSSEVAFVLQRPLEAIVSPLTMKLAGDLGRWVLQKLDDRQVRLNGAQRAAHWLIDHLTRLVADATRLSGALEKQIAGAAEDLRLASSREEDWQRAIAYFRMRTDEHAVLASALISKRLLTELKAIVDTITEFGRHLKNLASGMPRPDQPLGADDPLAKAISASFVELVDGIDQQLQASFITPNGGLFQTIMGSSRVRAQMLQELTRHARIAVERLSAKPELLSAAVASAGVHAALAIESAQANEPQPLLQHGGVYRSLAVMPNQSAGNAPELSADGERATVVGGIGNDVILCQEAWDLPIVSIAMDIIQRRRDYADFAARVVSRSDVAWTPLTAPVMRLPEAATNAFAGAMPMVTQVL
jgi:serine/threonine protein kinase